MFTKFALKSILVLCVIILLSTLVVGSAVTAKQSPFSNAILAAPPERALQGGSPVPGGPGFISVSTFGFKPYYPSTNLAYTNTWIYNDSSSYGVYFSPVNLPHGATITKVLFFYYDTVVGANMTFYLERVNLFDGSHTEVAQVNSTGSAGYGYVESVIFIPAVNNQLYSYIIEADIPGGYLANLSLINIRIDYGYPVYLPTVQN